MNSRQKGARGERQWRDELRANGYKARRGQQFCGTPFSPDVVCDDLAWIHFEVKAVERLNIEEAMDQARRDSGNGDFLPVVAHRRNYCRWMVTMDLADFLEMLPCCMGDECVVHEEMERIKWIHCLRKQSKRLNLNDAMEEARREAGERMAMVAHRKETRPWLVTMEAETFFRLLRGDHPEVTEGHGAPRSGRCRPNEAQAPGKKRDAEGTGDPRSGRCRGGTGHEGGDGAGQGAVTRAEADAAPRMSRCASTGEGGDGGSDQEQKESAADGGPQRSRWPGSGDDGADSGGATTTQPHGVDSIRHPKPEKDASGLPGQRAMRTDQVAARRVGPCGRPQRADTTLKAK